MTLLGYRFSRLCSRWLRHPLLRLLVLVFFVLDTLHLLDLHSSQTAAEARRRAPPPPLSRRIYIASQHWNSAQVLRERWNAALIDLVRDLGPDNVFVAIYESGSYDDTRDVLAELDARDRKSVV